MNHYLTEINRIKSICRSNLSQINTAIRTRKFIDHNFEKEVSLDTLSDVRFTSKFHLLRLYKKYYGITPRQYLIEKRIYEAKQMLTNGASVTEACYAVGFESLSSFSNLFKRKTGKSPSKYREEQFSRNESKNKISNCNII